MQYPAILREIEQVYARVFPEPLDRVLAALLKAWKREGPTKATTGSARRLRSRLVALKTDHAILKWLAREAPLPQMMILRWALWTIHLPALENVESSPDIQRLRLKIGQRYPIRDWAIAGLDLLKQRAPTIV